jgi:outer membrane protein
MQAVTRHFLTAAIVCAIESGAVAAQAVPPGGLSLTLDDAIARGVTQAPRMAEARARESAASSTVTARAALRLPSVSAAGSYFRTNHVDEFGVVQADGTRHIIFPDIPNNYDFRAEVNVPLMPTQLALAVIDAAKADVRVLEAARHVLEADLKLEIARAYWQLVTSRQSVQVLEQAQQRTEAWVGDVRARVDAGFLPPNDLLSARARRARESVQLIQAKNAAAMAEIELGRLVGAAPGQPIATLTTVDQPQAGVADVTGQPVDALVARAVARRPERQGLREQQASLAFQGTAALASRQPQVGVRAGIEPARPNARFVPRADQWKTSWDLGVSVVLPVFDGGKARANHAAAVAASAAIGHRIDELDALVAQDIRERLLDIESGRAALAASLEAVQATAEARRVVQERFNAGVATSSDMLDAQVALVEAELERTRLAAWLRLGEARLLHAVGGL